MRSIVTVYNCKRKGGVRMLLFSTVLEINDCMTKDAFIQLVIEWNQGSPHKENVIADINWNGERNIRYGSDSLWLAIEEYRNRNIIAVRYEKTESDGVIWGTEYVMNFEEMKMSIRLDRSYLEEALTINPSFSTPHFITLLIQKGYLKKDGDLPISREPILISEENLQILVDVINGKKKYHFPVVYISRTYYDEEPVDTRRLAGRLKGVAHVLIEKDSWLDSRIRRLCDGKNEYHGAIGIYYPNQAVGHKRYLYRAYEGSDTILFEKVIRNVIQYSNSQLVDMLYTWQGVNNALLRDRLSSQRAERLAAEMEKKQAKSEADALIESVDEEIQKLQRQVEELTRTNDALLYENQGLRIKVNSVEALPVLYFGNEDEFFPNEIKEMLLTVLEEKLRKLDEKTRQADVLRDIINNNGGCQHIAEKKAKKLKVELKGYKNVSNSLKQLLSEMGFIIEEQGKHYKLIYYGDARYWTTLAKTPSDNKSGTNTALTIIRNML